MKHWAILLWTSLLIIAFTAAGYSQTTTIKKRGRTVVFQDKFGNKTGSATKSRNTTTFRNASDKITGTAVSSGNKTTIRNSSGKRVATIPEPGK